MQKVSCNVASDRRAGSPEASRQLTRCGTILHERERGADEWGGIDSNRHRPSGYAPPADGHVAHSTDGGSLPRGRDDLDDVAGASVDNGCTERAIGRRCSSMTPAASRSSCRLQSSAQSPGPVLSRMVFWRTLIARPGSSTASTPGTIRGIEVLSRWEDRQMDQVRRGVVRLVDRGPPSSARPSRGQTVLLGAEQVPRLARQRPPACRRGRGHNGYADLHSPPDRTSRCRARRPLCQNRVRRPISSIS